MRPIYDPNDIEVIICPVCHYALDADGRCKCPPPKPTLTVDPHAALYWRPWESGEAGAVTVRVAP